MKKLITILILLIATTAFGLDIERSNYDTYDVNKTLYATKTSIFTFSEANINEDDTTWTMTGTGPLVHVTGNTTTITMTASEAIDATTPAVYKITITGTGGGATATYTFGGVAGTAIAASGAIAITDYLIPSTTASLIITPSSTCTVSITSITIEKLTDATGDLTIEGNLTIRSQMIVNSSNPATGFLPMITPSGKLTSGIGFTSSGYTDFFVSGVRSVRITNDSMILNNASGYFSLNGDVILLRLAANSLAMRNSTAAQTFSLYETYTDASNYEYYSIDAGVTTNDRFTFKANTLGSGSDDMGYNFSPAGKGVVSYTMYDHAATPVAPTRNTRTFLNTTTLAADADNACGGTADCLTLPIPTTMGFFEMWTDGGLYLSAVCVTAGTCTVITDSDAAGVGVEYNAAIADCTGLCLHDGGTNSIIFNDTAAAVTVTVRFTYD